MNYWINPFTGGIHRGRNPFSEEDPRAIVRHRSPLSRIISRHIPSEPRGSDFGGLELECQDQRSLGYQYAQARTQRIRLVHSPVMAERTNTRLRYLGRQRGLLELRVAELVEDLYKGQKRKHGTAFSHFDTTDSNFTYMLHDTSQYCEELDSEVRQDFRRFFPYSVIKYGSLMVLGYVFQRLETKTPYLGRLAERASAAAASLSEQYQQHVIPFLSNALHNISSGSSLPALSDTVEAAVRYSPYVLTVLGAAQIARIYIRTVAGRGYHARNTVWETIKSTLIGEGLIGAGLILSGLQPVREFLVQESQKAGAAVDSLLSQYSGNVLPYLEQHTLAPHMHSQPIALPSLPDAVSTVVMSAPMIIAGYAAARLAWRGLLYTTKAALSQAYIKPMIRQQTALLNTTAVQGEHIIIEDTHIDDAIDGAVARAAGDTKLVSVIPPQARGIARRAAAMIADSTPRYRGITFEQIGHCLCIAHDIGEEAEKLGITEDEFYGMLRAKYTEPSDGICLQDMYAPESLQRFEGIFRYMIDRTTRKPIIARTDCLIDRIVGISDKLVESGEYHSRLDAVEGVLAEYRSPDSAKKGRGESGKRLIDRVNEAAAREVPVFSYKLELVNCLCDVLRMVRQGHVNDETVSDAMHRDSIYMMSADFTLGQGNHGLTIGNVGYTGDEVDGMARLVRAGMDGTKTLDFIASETGLPGDSRTRETYDGYFKHATMYREHSPVNFLTDKESHIVDCIVNAAKLSDNLHNGETLQHLGAEKSLRNLFKYFLKPITLRPHYYDHMNSSTDFIQYGGRRIPMDILDPARVQNLVLYSAVQSDVGAAWISRVNELYDELPLALKRGLDSNGIVVLPRSLRLHPFKEQAGFLWRTGLFIFTPGYWKMFANPQKYSEMYEDIYTRAYQDVRAAFCTPGNGNL